MLFFALLAFLTVLAFPVTGNWPARMRVSMALALVLVGADHWINPERYLAMMPPWIPFHLELVLFTGAAEIAGAVGLLVPKLRRLALNGLAVEGLPQASWYYWARLPFQPLAIWWALFAAELIRWPFAARRTLEAAP